MLALFARVIPAEAWLHARGYQVGPERPCGQPDTLRHRLTARYGSGVSEEKAVQLAREFYSGLCQAGDSTAARGLEG